MMVSTPKNPERMTLLVDAERCTGCNTCMLICSFIHDRIFSYERSRIRVWRDDNRGIFIPILCEHCEDAPCVSVCPTGALFRDEVGIVRRNAVRCIGCNECMNACPIGAIAFSPDGEWMKCDLCTDVGGIPYCAQYCTARALRWVPEKLVARQRVMGAARRRVESVESGGGE